MMRRFAAFALLAGLAAAPATAQPHGERIGQDVLADFVLDHRVAGGGNLIEERVPIGESVRSWTKMVTLQRFAGVAARRSAADYLEQIRVSLPSSCPGARTTPLAARQVDGRRAAAFRADCPRNPATSLPETFFMLAVEGAQDMHVVQVAFRRVPSEQDVVWAERHLDSVALCEAGDRRPVCLPD